MKSKQFSFTNEEISVLIDGLLALQTAEWYDSDFSDATNEQHYQQIQTAEILIDRLEGEQ